MGRQMAFYQERWISIAYVQRKAEEDSCAVANISAPRARGRGCSQADRHARSIGLYRKSIFPRREIAKKDRALRQITDRRTIRVNYRGSCIDITAGWIHLTKKPYPCHTRSSWRKLRLRRGPRRLRRGAARKGEDAEDEPDRSETKTDHDHSFIIVVRAGGHCWTSLGFADIWTEYIRVSAYVSQPPATWGVVPRMPWRSNGPTRPIPDRAFRESGTGS